jgi:hypothetical protein
VTPIHWILSSEGLRTLQPVNMGQSGPRPRHDVESGLPWQAPDTDASSLPDAVDPEKRSTEDTGRTSTDTSDGEVGREDPATLSRQQTREDGPGGGDNNGVLSRVVSRVLTRPSTKSSWKPGPPPNGGLQAWTAGKPFPHYLPSTK